MSIKLGNTTIRNIFHGNTSIKKIFIGDKMVFPDDNAIDLFIENCIPLGGDADFIRSNYNNIDDSIKERASILLFPSVVESGVVYGMNNESGDLVPFAFSRASNATYFDKNLSMKSAISDMPRIDFRNYSENAKILMEKESTNLISSFLNQSGLIVSQLDEVFFDYDKWTKISKTTGSGTMSARLSIFAQNNFGMKRDYVASVLVTKADSNAVSLGIYENGFNNTANKSIKFGSGNFEIIAPSLFRVVGLDENNPTLIEISGTTTINHVELIIYPGDYSVSSTWSNKYGLAQIERDKMYSTSYIPKTETRKEDQLSINLETNCQVFIKTIFEEKYIEKTAGLWNIQEDITGSDGIEYIAILGRT